MIRVVIVGDIQLYREGLALALGREADLHVAGSAADRLGALSLLGHCPVDLVLVDMAMPESIDTVRGIVALAPSIRVVALAVPEVDRDVIACAEAGATGYVSRTGSIRDLIDAIRGVAQGEVRSSPRIVASLFHRLATLAAERSSGRPRTPLTVRELQIVRLIGEGYSNKGIATALGISLPTVKNHVHHVLEKLRVRRRVDAAMTFRQGFGSEKTVT